MTAWTGNTPTGTFVTGAGGVPLRVVSAGDPGRRAVLIASACGMPAELCEAWMRVLARDHHVVTWETRGLSGGSDGGCANAEDFDAMGHQIADQVGDLVMILDHYQLRSVHVMGLCDGAVLALRTAALHPDRVASLSLWHGDYELGPGTPKSSHQRNLRALIEIAAESRQSAAMVHGVLPQNATAGLPPDIAALVLRPYRDVETFYRYSRLSGALMSQDIRDTFTRVDVPTLVVTSEDDHTTHPAGSRAVAAALTLSRLHVEPHGDHISVFSAGDALTRVATRFLTETANL